MNRRNLILAIGAVAIAGFAILSQLYNRTPDQPAETVATADSTAYVRPHALVLGPVNAPVTIVEFFDPSCETCRALYPVVKQLMAEYPKDVRVILRYAAFHEGSDEVVRMLEMARKQDKFIPVTEALLAAQPEWADHEQPKLERAWEVAAAAGLDVDAARQGMMSPEITAVLTQDAADIETLGVQQTPTFFVNGKPLTQFGIEELQELVRAEVEAARK